MDSVPRPFGLWTAIAMIVGGMIGTGIFVLPGILAPLGWTAVIGWLVVGAGTLSIARVMIALSFRNPDEPSILTICGETLGLLPGRLLLWSYWVGTICTLPAMAITAAAYLLHLFPSLPQGQTQQVVAGAIILTLVTAINLRDMRQAGRFQIITTALKLLPLAVVIAILGYLLMHAYGTHAPRVPAQQPLTPFSAWQLTPVVGITFYAMIGFENACLIAGRVRNPSRNVLRATTIGLGLVLTIYFVVSTGIMLAMPASTLTASSAPIAIFVESHLGARAGDGIAVFAAISAIGGLNCSVLFMGELPLAMVRDGQLPQWMAPANARGIASRPMLFGYAFCLGLMLFSVTAVGEKVLDFFLRLTTASSIWFYLGVAAAALMAKAGRILPYVSIAFCLWVLYGTGVEAGMLGFALLLAGLPLHFLLGGRSRTLERNCT